MDFNSDKENEIKSHASQRIMSFLFWFEEKKEKFLL